MRHRSKGEPIGGCARRVEALGRSLTLPRVQTELLNWQRWRTRIELANALFEYLEIFHNRRRRHSSLGMLTPIEYELQISRAEPVA